MNQSKFVEIPCNLLKAREKSRVKVAIGFDFPFQWLINWREILKPITKRINCNRVITFDSHLKTTLVGKTNHLICFSLPLVFSFASSQSLPSRHLL